MKHFLYMFVIWVMFNNGQVWRYPQADYWMPTGPMHHARFEIKNGMSGKSVVVIPEYKINHVSFHRIPGEYHTYQNPNLPIVSPDVEETYKNGMHIAEEMHK
jgi:hypothetical protein